MRSPNPAWRALIAASLIVVTCAAQRPARRGRAPAAQEPVAVERDPGLSGIAIGKDGWVLPAGDIDLRDLIDSAAKYLQRNILYNQMELAQVPGTTVTLQKELAVDALGCEEVLGDLLGMKGFALCEVNADKGVYEVIFMGGARRNEVFSNAVHRTPEEVLLRPRLKSPVLTQVLLEHINANIATNALRPFFAQAGGGSHSSSGVTFGTAGNNKALILLGFQDQVAQVLQLLRTVDVPDETMPPSRLEQLVREVEALKAQVARLRGESGDK